MVTSLVILALVGAAEDAGGTVVDLSDDWTPLIFSETAEHPQVYRQTFLALANERMERIHPLETARRDRYFELFGIFPTVTVLRRRMLDEARHTCHDGVDGAALRALKRTLAPGMMTGPVASNAAAALAGVQAHLRCEGFLDTGSEGRFDARTHEALRVYQRRHMIPSAGVLDDETRETLLMDSRELDFRTLLRVLRERVIDATGLIEDGSAQNAWEPVLGRFIDSQEYRRVLRTEPLSRGAPDLVARATETAARALGWTSPEAAARALVNPLAQVSVRFPRLPDHRRTPLVLRAEIDRGDVWTEYPFDFTGNTRRSPVANRPTFTLLAQTESGEVALVRWPTTIGAWKLELVDGTETLRYKASPVGRRFWRDLVAAPAWFPPDTTPDRELVRRRPDGRWGPDGDAVGPGYRSAYGLMALFHHRATGITGGAPQYADAEIRTHGSGNYRSILRGSSHGCHRLFNHLAIRLGSFVLGNSEYLRRGLGTERYVRSIHWKGKTHRLRAGSRGYRYELQPPVPVDVLPGRSVRSRFRVAPETVSPPPGAPASAAVPGPQT